MKTAEIRNLIQQSLCTKRDGEGLFIGEGVSRIGVFHMDASGVLDRVHHHFLDITGRPCNQVIGRVWLQTVFCDDRDRVCREWYQSIMKNKSFTSSFKIPDRSRAALKQVSCSLVPELSDHNRTIGYYGVFVEASEYRQAV